MLKFFTKFSLPPSKTNEQRSMSLSVSRNQNSFYNCVLFYMSDILSQQEYNIYLGDSLFSSRSVFLHLHIEQGPLEKQHLSC